MASLNIKYAMAIDHLVDWASDLMTAKLEDTSETATQQFRDIIHSLRTEVPTNALVPGVVFEKMQPLYGALQYMQSYAEHKAVMPKEPSKMFGTLFDAKHVLAAANSERYAKYVAELHAIQAALQQAVAKYEACVETATDAEEQQLHSTVLETAKAAILVLSIEVADVLEDTEHAQYFVQELPKYRPLYDDSAAAIVPAKADELPAVIRDWMLEKDRTPAEIAAVVTQLQSFANSPRPTQQRSAGLG